MVSLDQFTPPNCVALTCIGYKPKFANDAFGFKETVAEMRQHLVRAKKEAAAAATEEPEPMVTEEQHKEALATAQTTIFASESSDIQVAPMLGVEFVDPVKYQAYLGVKSNPGEEAATASTRPTAHTPQDTVTIMMITPSAETVTRKGDATPQCRGALNLYVIPPDSSRRWGR